jgi:uracil-DNA glycosylase family protein
MSKIAKPSASLALVPHHASFARVVAAARRCRACDLHRNATQTVFGEGPVPAAMMVVGEQPGDQEDKQGHPFVGRAGRRRARAPPHAGIPRDQVYVTNAVKHFKWEPRGKRRLHSRPNASEVQACHGWLEAELALVRPTVVVCLGATAAAAFFGTGVKLSEKRGQVLEDSRWAPRVVLTFHPSAVLRMMNDKKAYAAALEQLVSDLRVAASLVSFGRTRQMRASR